jgi:Na+/H+ antiporter NhaD/arsenite permease-like protein
MDPNTINMIVSGGIFVLAYVFIIIDKWDRTAVALIGASAMVLSGMITQEHAFAEIDYNTLLLLTGMMIIVMTAQRSGLFEYLAIRAVKAAKGEPVRILILLSLITGVLSALLDNVTTILLIVPVTLSVAKDLKIKPMPFIISEIFASNVGGTATLIGDPPNIMIGSATGLSFMDFLRVDAVIALPLLVLTTGIFALIFRKKLRTTLECRASVMLLDEKAAVKDRKLLIKSVVILGLAVLSFGLQEVTGIEASTTALACAVLLLLISGIKTVKILKEVEWSTILFFGGLFIMVGALKASGAIGWLAQSLTELTQGDMLLTVLAVLWLSAIASAFIDNIPFVATMIPLIHGMGTLGAMDTAPLWWALSLGACLGGNGTLIGASANVIASGMAEEHGHKIGFRQYFKYAFPMMLLTTAAASAYLILVYQL